MVRPETSPQSQRIPRVIMRRHPTDIVDEAPRKYVSAFETEYKGPLPFSGTLSARLGIADRIYRSWQPAGQIPARQRPEGPVAEAPRAELGGSGLRLSTA
jgi:hypothetical protein